MRTIVLEWKETNMSQLDSMDNTCFYMLSSHRKVLYIGITKPSSKQSVQQEIKSKRYQDKIGDIIDKATIWLGYNQTNRRYDEPILRLTDKNVLEIENLLINKTNPELNDYCRDAYSGRDLRIINKKCGKLLKEEMVFENKKKSK